MEFVALFKQNEKALQNFAFKLTRDINKTQDLVQETALKAYKAFHTFQENTSFKSWTFTILKNTFITNYRKKMRRPTINTELTEVEFAINSQNHSKNPAISNLHTEFIQNSFKDLSYKSRLLLELYIYGYRYNEISEMLNIPIGTVKSRINYGRNKMKKQFRHLRIAS